MKGINLNYKKHGSHIESYDRACPITVEELSGLNMGNTYIYEYTSKSN